MEGFMGKNGLWNLAREKILREGGALPKGKGDAIREYKAMTEENFLSSWLREEKEWWKLAMRMMKKGAK